tara:strand:+ start:2200 stop:2640 length:441 start_codon:yes stop_codon:yes gene_type:complete
MIKEKLESNKIFFRRIILLMVFTVILTGLIPSIFDFEKYYGIRRFINPGYTSILLEGKFELYATIFMSFFSLVSLLLIYFFIPIGKYFFLIYFCMNFFLIMLGGDIINYGLLYPVEWIKNVTEALLLYQMFLGANKENFIIRKFKT